jgi:ribonuclease Z
MKLRWPIIGLGAIALAAYLAAPTVLAMPEVEAFLFRRGFAANQARNEAVRAMVDAKELRVLLCGTASPLPNASRAGPCTAIIAGGHIWMVDAGGGGMRNLVLWHLPTERLAGVLLTHFHSDHIEDLGEANLQSWVAGRQAPLPVYGGPGVTDVVQGFTQAYLHDTGYRVAHHGADALPPDDEKMVPHEIGSAPGTPLAEGETAVVLDQDGLKITAIGVNHFPVVPAYAYRFDYGGRSVVVSGDTKESLPLATAAKGTDVLVHEAMQNDLLKLAHQMLADSNMPRLAKMSNDIQTYHTTPDQAANIANLAGAKLLVLTHLTPALPDFLMGPAFMRLVHKVRPEGTVVGRDGLLVSLPGGTQEVRQEVLF